MKGKEIPQRKNGKTK